MSGFTVILALSIGVCIGYLAFTLLASFGFGPQVAGAYVGFLLGARQAIDD